jgi:general secretion pathway protein N
MNRKRIGPLDLAAAIILCGAIGTRILFAAAPASFDTPPADVAPGTVKMTRDVIAPPGEAARKPGLTSSNPLWAVPLSSLTATRERPIFLPSRRPYASPVAAARQHVEPVKPPPPAQPARPLLALVATVIGDSQSMAVFSDTTTGDTIRLRIEEGHAGWILRSVKGREAKLQKDGEIAILALPPHDSGASTDTAAVSPAPVPIPLPAHLLVRAPARRP